MKLTCSVGYHKCPECGTAMVMEGGRWKCPHCGYTNCASCGRIV